MVLPTLSIVSNNPAPEASTRRSETLRIAAGKNAPVARLEVLLQLDAPPVGTRGAPQFGETTVQEYVQDWLDRDVPKQVRTKVFRNFVPQIEPLDVAGMPGLKSYRSLMVRAWVENPCVFTSHLEVAKMIQEAAIRIQPLFLEWFDSGWVVKSVYRLRDLSGTELPEWMQETLRRLNIIWVPFSSAA